MIYLGHSLHFKPSLHIVHRESRWRLCRGNPLTILSTQWSKISCYYRTSFLNRKKIAASTVEKKSSIIFLDFKTCLERFAGHEVFPSSISSLSDCWSCQNARLVWFVWSLVSSWRLRWEPEVASFCKQGNDAADFLLFSPDFPLQSEHSELLRCEKGHLFSIPGWPHTNNFIHMEWFWLWKVPFSLSLYLSNST